MLPSSKGPVGSGRIAQRESTVFTRRGSLVQSQVRPPFSTEPVKKLLRGGNLRAKEKRRLSGESRRHRFRAQVWRFASVRLARRRRSPRPKSASRAGMGGNPSGLSALPKGSRVRRFSPCTVRISRANIGNPMVFDRFRLVGARTGAVSVKNPDTSVSRKTVGSGDRRPSEPLSCPRPMKRPD